MPTISLCMIVKNEEKTLARVLVAAAQFCDEMIVVDTGSTDDTTRIAELCGAQVYRFPWVDDFSAARNYSFSKATGDWILWLDADDVLSPETVEVGKRLKAEVLPTLTASVIFCPYHYFIADDGRVEQQQQRERFLRRAASPKWEGRIHEVVRVQDDNHVTVPQFIVTHEPIQEQLDRKVGRNLAYYEKYCNPKDASTRDLYNYGRELGGIGRYAEAIAMYEKYFDIFPEGMTDIFEEPYMAAIDMCLLYRTLREPWKAAKAASRAIAFNAARAEAYVLLGMTAYETGNYAAAFPCFLAGAACKPPTHGGLIYRTYYSSAVHDMIKDCKARLAEADASSMPKPLDESGPQVVS